MPAAPELAQTLRAIGLVEVDRKAVAEQGRQADGDVAVGGEVAVDLHRVAISREQQIERAVTGGVEEHRIDQVGREIRGDHHFLEQAAKISSSGLASSTRAGTGCSSCGRKNAARTMGPATSCGKNERYSRMSVKRRHTATSPR